MSLISALLFVWYGVGWLLGIGPIPKGFTTLALLQLFAIGMNAFLLGVMGEYVARIFENVRGPGGAIVERTIEFGLETYVGVEGLPSRIGIADSPPKNVSS